jgi:dihydrofolate reductase
MRTVTFGGATSLDNFLARPDGGVDWLRWNDGAAEIMKTFWSSIDTVLMGRKTYEAGARLKPATGRSKRKSKPARQTGPVTYIFSKTLPDDDGLTIVREDVVPFVRRLKEEPGKDICLMGGGELARPLFEAGLIDRVGFNVHPVLLGAGVPAFHVMAHQIDLELVECRPLGNGCVYLDYRVLQPVDKTRRSPSDN